MKWKYLGRTLFIHSGKLNFKLHGSPLWGDYWVSAVYIPMQKSSPPFTLDAKRFSEHLLWTKHNAENTKVNQVLSPIWWSLLEQVLEPLSYRRVSRGKSLFLSVGFKTGMSLLTSHALCRQLDYPVSRCLSEAYQCKQINEILQRPFGTTTSSFWTFAYKEMSVVRETSWHTGSCPCLVGAISENGTSSRTTGYFFFISFTHQVLFNNQPCTWHIVNTQQGFSSVNE